MTPTGAHVARLGGDEFASCCAARSTLGRAERASPSTSCRCSVRPVDVRRHPARRARLHRRRGRGRGAATCRRCSSTPTSRCTRPRSERGPLVGLHAGDGDGRDRAPRPAAPALRRRRARGATCRCAYQPQLDSARAASRPSRRWSAGSDPALRALLGPDHVRQPRGERRPHPTPSPTSVLERALVDPATLARAGHDVSVAVNLSARQLSDEALPSASSPPWPGTTCRRAPRRRGDREQPDDRRAPRRRSCWRPCGRSGFLLSIDDFGTGYSSLVRLTHIDVDELKIDRGFVADLASGGNDDILVRTIIDLAQQPRPGGRRRGRRDRGPRRRLRAWAATGCRATCCPGRSRAEQVLSPPEHSGPVELG